MRSHYCGLIGEADVDRSVTLCGWADARRDHGGVVFVDLRDHEGIVQIVADPDNAAVFEVASNAGYTARSTIRRSLGLRSRRCSKTSARSDPLELPI